jgi:hypothetical protein
MNLTRSIFASTCCAGNSVKSGIVRPKSFWLLGKVKIYFIRFVADPGINEIDPSVC